MRGLTSAARSWKTWLAVGLMAVVFVLLLRGVASPPSSEPATTPVAAERPGLQSLMMSVSERIDRLPGLSENGRLRTMRVIVDLLREGLAPHLEAEPLQGYGGEAAVLAVEHEILRRRLAELEDLSTAPFADSAGFARRAQRLLGLLEAHLEVEQRFRIEAESPLAGP